MKRVVWHRSVGRQVFEADFVVLEVIAYHALR